MQHKFELKPLPPLDNGELEMAVAWITLGNELVKRANDLKNGIKNLGCTQTLGILQYINQKFSSDSNNIYFHIASDLMQRMEQYDLLGKAEKFNIDSLSTNFLDDPHTRLSISALKYISSNIKSEMDVCIRTWLVSSISIDNIMLKEHNIMQSCYLWFDAVPNLYGDIQLNAEIFAFNALKYSNIKPASSDKAMDFLKEIIQNVAQNHHYISDDFHKKYKNDWVKFLMDLSVKDKELIRLSGNRSWLNLL
ncbi:MAG: hypothetical protein LBM93_02605 [Oscillospiraceae bacterium]|jgi:hypothetical protein|nr:hypothetical protein [Oscillospiraceae bacterium]